MPMWGQRCAALALSMGSACGALGVAQCSNLSGLQGGSGAESGTDTGRADTGGTDSGGPDAGPSILAAGETSPVLLGLDGTYVYWLAGGALRRAPTAGCSATTVFADAGLSKGSVWLD